MRKPSRLALVITAVVLLAAVGYVIVRVSRSPQHAVAVAAPAPAPVRVSETPVPALPVPALPVLRHDVVAPAAPTAFEISGPAFDIKAHVCSMAYVRPLDPPGDQRHTVCWVRNSFGVAPGSTSGGTSYILGHAWSKAKLVLNPLSELAMKQVTGRNPQLQSGVPTYPVTLINGYKVALQTPKGSLIYVVTRAFAVAKERAADVQSLMANTPNRVVLITCGVAHGADADYNIIVDAYLQSSIAV
jgi:Sortase domain